MLFNNETHFRNSLKYLMAGVFLLFLLLANASTNRAPLGRYKWKYTTITHQLLKIEEESNMGSNAENFDKQYQLIDLVIDKCGENISRKGKLSYNSVENAQLILRTIDSTLASCNFFICIKVDRLSDALSPQSKSQYNCRFKNELVYRKQYFSLAKEVYKIDCDLGSFLYLGIGEALKLPLRMVEIPDHNFVRWQFSGTSYLNWDVNSASVISDEDFRKGNSPASSQIFSLEEEKKWKYLQAWKDNDILGYYYWVLGRTLKKSGKIAEAQQCYEKAILNRPECASYKHSYAYMIIFNPYYTSIIDFNRANELELAAANFNPINKEYVETLACSYALLGNFNKALQTINTLTFPNQKLIEAFNNQQTGRGIYRVVD